MTRAVSETTLRSLYEQDETAWLEQMAKLAAGRRHEQIDWEHLTEYLSDMAIRDRREVLSRLRVLLKHLLKWEHQPQRRTDSWESTIIEQRYKLREILASRTLHRHAVEVLDKAYAGAVVRAAKETRLLESSFPTRCPWPLKEVLGEGR